MVYSQDSKNNPDSGDSTLYGSGRLSIDARTQLTDGIAGIGHVEWDVADADQKDTFKARYLWVGADFGQFGVVKAGRFEDAVKYVVKTTDIFDDYGCNGQLDNDDKRNGMFGYSWSGWGFDVNLTYGTAKDQQAVDGAWYEDESVDIKNSFAASIGYTTPDVLFGPISFKTGYGYARFQDDNRSASQIIDTPDEWDAGNRIYDNYKQWAASLSWGTLAQGPYVGVLYQVRDFTLNKIVGYDIPDYKVQGVEAVVAYTFENGVSVRTGWEWMNIDEDDFVNGDAGRDLDAYTVPVYVNYQVTPNFNVWAEARFDVGTDDEKVVYDANGMPNKADNFAAFTGGENANDFSENVYSVGARYTF